MALSYSNCKNVGMVKLQNWIKGCMLWREEERSARALNLAPGPPGVVRLQHPSTFILAMQAVKSNLFPTSGLVSISWLSLGDHIALCLQWFNADGSKLRYLLVTKQQNLQLSAAPPFCSPNFLYVIIFFKKQPVNLMLIVFHVVFRLNYCNDLERQLSLKLYRHLSDCKI